MTLEQTKKELRDRYGINSFEELIQAMNESKGLDIGIFTKKGKNNERQNNFCGIVSSCGINH